MGFLDNAGLDYFFGKVKQALGLKMDAAVYAPQGRGMDVFGYVDALPVRRLVGTQEQPIDIDTLTEDGIYYFSNISKPANPNQELLLVPLAFGNPMYISRTYVSDGQTAGTTTVQTVFDMASLTIFTRVLS